MKTGRRQFIASLLAAGFVPKTTWADVGSPSLLSAAALPDDTYVLCGIGTDLNVTFQRPLPTRGHAAAAHPIRAEAVAFARRPGTYAVVIDCMTGSQIALLTTPAGRHFYGHGAFSSDGRLLYTTENDYAAGRGRIGVWDAHAGYQRIAEFSSGGTGPHDIKRLPNSDTLVVANGGIDTHPESGRTKLNIPTMQPNLSYITDGVVTTIAKLPPAMHKSSIRHLAVAPDGSVAFGMQQQGDGQAMPLVGVHRNDGQISLMDASSDQLRDMQGYVGSIAYIDGGDTIAATSPRGGVVQLFDARTAEFSGSMSMADVCGVSAIGDGAVLTSGTGVLSALTRDGQIVSKTADLKWDNHLISI